jgi:hypothetical protein
MVESARLLWNLGIILWTMLRQSVSRQLGSAQPAPGVPDDGVETGGIAMNWVDIPVPATYSREEEYLTWAKKNCPTYITNDAVQRHGEYYYRFYFGDSEQGQRDRVAFALRWL